MMPRQSVSAARPTGLGGCLAAARLQEVFDQETGSTLRLALLVIGTAAFAHIPVHLRRDIAGAHLLALAAALVGIGCLGAWLWTRTHPVPDNRTNLAFALTIGAAAANTIVNQAVMRDPLLTINITMVIIATGLCIVSLRWVLVVSLPAALAWFAFAAPPLDSPDWPTAATGVLFGFCAGAIVNSGRRKALARLVEVTLDAEHAAVIDALTQVYNRRGLDVAADQLVRTARRGGVPVGVLVIDIDRFKDVNDEYGHHAGDSILIAVANALRQSGRDSDIVARWGGDEFVVVTHGVPPGADELSLRIENRLLTDPATARCVAPVTVSVGAACAQLDRPDDLGALISAADADMYGRRAERRTGTSALSRSARN